MNFLEERGLFTIFPTIYHGEKYVKRTDDPILRKMLKGQKDRQTDRQTDSDFVGPSVGRGSINDVQDMEEWHCDADVTNKKIVILFLLNFCKFPLL